MSFHTLCAIILYLFQKVIEDIGKGLPCIEKRFLLIAAAVTIPKEKKTIQDTEAIF